MPAAVTRFVERTVSKLDRIDRDLGILYGVKVLGRHSKNGREYTDRAMQKAVSLYEGTKIYLNHPDKSKLSDDRSFHDWVGVLRNPRYAVGGSALSTSLLSRCRTPRAPLTSKPPGWTRSKN